MARYLQIIVYKNNDNEKYTANRRSDSIDNRYVIL